MTQKVKNLLEMQDTQVWSLGWEDPLEKGMATHSSILAWRIPWTEEPGGLQSMGLQRIGHDWTINTFFLLTVVFITPLCPQTSHIELKLHLQMWWRKDWIKKFKNLPSARLTSHTFKKYLLNEWMNEPYWHDTWNVPLRSQKPGFWVSAVRNSITLWWGLAASHSLE